VGVFVSQSNPVQADVEIIPVPNILKLKVGSSGGGGIDLVALAKAEAALKALSSNFGDWLQEEIAKMEAARAVIQEQGATAENAKALYLRAHDLKGLGSTYEFPLVSRISGSLCKLLEEGASFSPSAIKLADAHIGAIKAMVRDGVKTDNHPVGAVLAAELETRVAQFRPDIA
jgi:hypothetical protein